MRKRILLTAIAAIMGINASAYDFEEGGIYYNLSGSQATVTSGDNYYSGDVSIPSSVTHEGVTYAVTSIDDEAFYDCSSLTTIDIPNTVTTIGERAFMFCSRLTSVEIPYSVTSIGTVAFYGCDGLTRVDFASLKHLLSIDFAPYHANPLYYAGHLYLAGQEVTEITIPDDVNVIKDLAFDGACYVTSFTLHEGITSIGKSAFSHCTSMTSITIPSSVTLIDSYAFDTCTGLTNFYCLAPEPPTLGSSVFTGVNLSNITLQITPGCEDAYSGVYPWNTFGNIVPIQEVDPYELLHAVQYLYDKGIIDHNTIEEALTDDPLLRQHLAKIAFRGVYSTGEVQVPETVVSDNFPTVYEDLAEKTATNDYYYQAARALLYLDYGDGVTPFDRNGLNFFPANNIYRLHTLKVLMETFNIQPDVTGSYNPFPTDPYITNLASKDPFLMGYVRKADIMGIITRNNATFRATDNCTRGEAFLMLYRIMKAVEAGTISAPHPTADNYFEPLNTTLATISLGAGLSMGNFQHYTKTSFAMSGTVPLIFAHAYNSYNTTLPEVFFGANNTGDTYQPLGDGWSHSYHSFITIVGDIDDGTARAAVHWGGGSIDVYKSENGDLVPESMGVFDTFTWEDHVAVIKSKSQMEYRFSRLGGEGASALYLYSIKDRNGNELSINYQDGVNGGKRISNVSDGNRSLSFYYLSGTDLVSEVRDPLSRSIYFNYFDNPATGKKQLQSFTDAENNTTTYEYFDLTKAGPSKLLKKIRLPKGNYIENQYDANRRLSQTVSGGNNVPTTKTSVEVTANYGSGSINTQSKVTVERGAQSSEYRYTYNANNVMTRMTGAKDMFVNSEYDNTQHPELPTAIQNNRTNVSGITYDKNWNVASITVKSDNGDELTTTMTYDDMNNLKTVTDPKNNMTEYFYNGKGNLIQVSAPEGVESNITVNAKGLPTQITNAMGVVTRYEYNDFGNVETVKLPALGLYTTSVYDDASRLTKFTDALQRETKFEYDGNDNLKRETDAKNHETIYSYDENDNLTSITNAKGGVTKLTYDYATDWLTSVEFGGFTKQYSYNKDGSLATFTKPDNTTLNYSYDEIGRITFDGVNSYTYDDKFRLYSVSDDSKTLTFDYDGFNRITGTTCGGHSNSYGYDENGNCTNINGTTYEYDGLNRMKWVKFNGKTIYYDYRKDSQLDKVRYPNGMTTEFGYDDVGRMISKTTKLSNGTVIAGYSYELDNVGNIKEQTAQEPYIDIVLPDENTTYSYNEVNRITRAGDTTFDFDWNGNTTSRGNETYTWDVQDRLTDANGTTITYDPLGLIASYGDITFTTDPLGIGNVLSDSRSGAQYIYGNGLEACVKNGRVSYYVTDFRGSVVAIVDESGNITHKYQYDEFGNVVQKEEADYNPFQYVGKYGVMYLTDHLYYMRARHYDPTIGRFLSEDPIWSTNLYPYADNNPLMKIDPRGLTPQDEARLAEIKKAMAELDEEIVFVIHKYSISGKDAGYYDSYGRAFDYFIGEWYKLNTERKELEAKILKERKNQTLSQHTSVNVPRVANKDYSIQLYVLTNPLNKVDQSNKNNNDILSTATAPARENGFLINDQESRNFQEKTDKVYNVMGGKNLSADFPY